MRKIKNVSHDLYKIEDIKYSKYLIKDCTAKKKEFVPDKFATFNPSPSDEKLSVAPAVALNTTQPFNADTLSVTVLVVAIFIFSIFPK